MGSHNFNFCQHQHCNVMYRQRALRARNQGFKCVVGFPETSLSIRTNHVQQETTVAPLIFADFILENRKLVTLTFRRTVTAILTRQVNCLSGPKRLSLLQFLPLVQVHLLRYWPRCRCFLGYAVGPVPDMHGHSHQRSMFTLCKGVFAFEDGDPRCYCARTGGAMSLPAPLMTH